MRGIILPRGNPYYKYEYNGHELQTETGWSDFGFRQYMPDIGRFGVIDPLADTTLQAYSFASNNPIFNIDFLGLLSTPPTGSNGYSIGQVWTDGEGWWKRINGGWKNTKSDETVIDEVEVGGGGGAAGSSLGGIIAGAIVTMGDSVNNMLTQAFFGIGSNRSMHNYQQNLSRFQLAVMNNKGAREVEEFENFLFLELPASFAGGELLSVGWRAAGMSRFICRPLGRLSNGLIKLCFTEGTLVVTEDGNRKIEDIREGDLVWSYNETTGRKELKKVVALSRNTSSSLVKITVNGTEITCTPEHPFYTNGTWTVAKDLTPGMLLTTLDGKTSPIASVSFLEEKVKVYNFEVEGNHNYYVSEEGILVHNDCLDWLSKARSLKVIENGCEVIADRVVKSLGQGAEYLQITPRFARFVGDVNGEFSGWRWHVAAIKDGRVFDRLTGKAGMLVEDYIKLFDDHLFLDFEQTAIRTVK